VRLTLYLMKVRTRNDQRWREPSRLSDMRNPMSAPD
jgi:hypothetical protein